MIDYICNKCGCEFSVNYEYIKRMEIEGRYISCPFGHRSIRVVEDIEKIMTERKAVEM